MPPAEIAVEVRSEDDTTALGRAIADVVGPGTVLGLIGPLGAGKTRLSRAVAEALGVEPSAIASPTYVLIHEYEGRLPVYHFDAYRLRGPEDFEALGAAEYLEGDGVCLVEWADRVADRLPSSSWRVRVVPVSETARRFEFALGGPEAERLARAIEAEGLAGAPR